LGELYVANAKLFKAKASYSLAWQEQSMSELRTLGVVAVFIGTVIGLTSLFVFNIPPIYSLILSLAACVLFFFIILWSSYLFIYR